MTAKNVSLFRRSLEVTSDASFGEKGTLEDWASQSSLSLINDERRLPCDASSTSQCDVEEVTSLRAELAAERARAAAAARAQDARLAELHAVLAELVRRRGGAGGTGGRGGATIPEEERGDSTPEECESTTQPAGELDNDADQSRTDQNSSSLLSPSSLPTPHEPHLHGDQTDADSTDQGLESARGAPIGPLTGLQCNNEAQTLVTCMVEQSCQDRLGGRAGAPPLTSSSCSRERGSLDEAQRPHSGRYDWRQAKLASRVKLKKTGDSTQLSDEVAERLAAAVGAQAGLREALLAAGPDGTAYCVCGGGHVVTLCSPDARALTARLAATEARAARLEADLALQECALARATATAQRLSLSCAVHESGTVSLCAALRAADRALETYDVLLALAETRAVTDQHRAAAELIASRLLHRLETELDVPAPGEPLLSPGPWMQAADQCGTTGTPAPAAAWSPACETRLRCHAAALKARTASLRHHHPPPALFSCHDVEDEEEEEGLLGGSGAAAGTGEEEPGLPPRPPPPARSTALVTMSEMEQAVLMQEVAASREERASLLALLCQERARADRLQAESSMRRPRERHWLETEPSETDL